MDWTSRRRAARLFMEDSMSKAARETIRAGDHGCLCEPNALVKNAYPNCEMDCFAPAEVLLENCEDDEQPKVLCLGHFLRHARDCKERTAVVKEHAISGEMLAEAVAKEAAKAKEPPPVPQAVKEAQENAAREEARRRILKGTGLFDEHGNFTGQKQ
jgi:hypothetical protein